MNVLHIISSPASGGSEVYVRDLCRNMVNDVENIHVLFLQRSSDSSRDLQFEREFLAALESAGIHYDFIGLNARRRPWLGMMVLRDYVRRNRISIIHAHLLYGVLFSLAAPRIPVVLTVHSAEIRVPWVALKLIEFRIASFVAISNLNYRLLKRVCKSSVVLIRNAIDSSRVQKKKIKLNKNEPVKAIFVGRLGEEKNVSFLLKSFSKLHDRARFFLTVVGEGPEREMLEGLARSLGISDRVKFTGAVNDVERYLNEADIFVMSSFLEGLPIALIEASITGLPVLVTNAGGSSEVVNECINGFVVEVGDGESYVRALSLLIEDAQLRWRLSHNALSLSTRFHIEEAKNKHIRLYKSVLS